MSKALILIALVACAFAANPFSAAKAFMRDDACAIKGLETIKPSIQRQVEILKKDSNNVVAKAELLALVDEAKTVYEGCGTLERAAPVLGDAVKAAGIGFMLASNCSKDLGIVLLLVDEVIQDPTDLTQDIFLSIFLYILGRQGVADCEQFINFVL